jgi:hypothetical protein
MLSQFFYNYDVWYWQEKQPHVNEEYFFGRGGGIDTPLGSHGSVELFTCQLQF